MGEKPLTDSSRADLDSYCRSIETYLCRRNGGQLVRIVGPAFDLVRRWAERGVPLSVVYRGIDHRLDRLARADRRQRRRRPIRIEFCEDDVLDVFDEWRHAVGVTAERDTPDGDAGGDEEAGRRSSLPAHLQRVIARVTTLRAAAENTPADHLFLEGVVRELDGMLGNARSLRGERRGAALSRLAELDGELARWAERRLSTDVLGTLRREAELDLAPFRERMPEDAYRRSLDASTTRLVRERAGVPRLILD